MSRALSFSLLVAALLSVGGCAASDSAVLHDRALRARKAMPRCDAGDVGACGEACEAGGSNKACTRGCDANQAPACAQLAGRFEKGVDYDDAEAAPRHEEPAEPEKVTDLYEKACKLGYGDACQLAGGRILNGVGRGKRDGGTAVDLLKLGCQKLHSAESCCSMSQLNLKLAEGNNVNTITDFRGEAGRWARLSEQYGKSCPEKIIEPPAAEDPLAPPAPAPAPPQRR